MADVLPFSKHMKTNLGSLTHCISQPIAHRYRQTAHGPARKLLFAKLHWLSANGGDKKENKISRLAEFKFVRRHKRQFSQFYAAISNAFIPVRRDFHQKLFSLFLKNRAVLYLIWSYYCTKCKKSLVFVGCAG